MNRDMIREVARMDGARLDTELYFAQMAKSAADPRTVEWYEILRAEKEDRAQGK
jgi:hypothetical protein